jgi:hypothetical protein
VTVFTDPSTEKKKSSKRELIFLNVSKQILSKQCYSTSRPFAPGTSKQGYKPDIILFHKEKTS